MGNQYGLLYVQVEPVYLYIWLNLTPPEVRKAVLSIPLEGVLSIKEAVCSLPGAQMTF